MQTAHIKLVTIFGGGELEERLIRELQGAGARGFTITQARGRGIHGSRPDWLLDAKNVKIEVLCSAEVAEKILQVLSADFLPDDAVTAYVSDVEAIPVDKFVFRRKRGRRRHRKRPADPRAIGPSKTW